MLGAGRLATFWLVTLPLIRPGIFAGALFAFLISFDNLPISYFFGSASASTLPVVMLSYMQNQFDPAIAAISTVQMGLAVLILLVVDRFYGLRRIGAPAIPMDLILDRHRQVLRPRPRGAAALARHPERLAGGPARPLRLRQDHDAAHHRRVRAGRRRTGADRRQGRLLSAAEPAPPGHGVPELQPVPAHDGGGERRVRAAARRLPPGRDRHPLRPARWRWCAWPASRDRWPSQLSGGQQQRVALARSIVTNPSVLLLDEPLGALDKNLRESMQFELRQLQQTLGITTVLVTHDQEEALTMADQVAVMHDGSPAAARPPGRGLRPAALALRRRVPRHVEHLRRDGAGARDRLRHRAAGRRPKRRCTPGCAAQPGAQLEIAVRPEKVALERGPAERAQLLAATIIGLGVPRRIPRLPALLPPPANRLRLCRAPGDVGRTRPRCARLPILACQQDAGDGC